MIIVVIIFSNKKKQYFFSQKGTIIFPIKRNKYLFNKKELTALCVVVASTKNILSTKSCCSLRATLKRLFDAIAHAWFDTQLLIVFHDLPFYFWVISNDIANHVFTSRVSASKEKRRRRTNFRGEERSSPVSPEEKNPHYFFKILLHFLQLDEPGCSLQFGLVGRGGGVQEQRCKKRQIYLCYFFHSWC